MTNSLDQGQMTGRIGQIVKNTYRLTRIIGKGGMGEVYEAEHVALPRRFAVKFLLGDLGLGAEILARFHREASIAASVGSEHIVEVFDYGQSSDGGYFMVMELLEGDTLSERIAAQGAFTPEAWLVLFAQLADGLEAAHAVGVVHRDLKPDNVFLARNKRGDEVLKILDFGISKIRVSGAQVTQAGAVMGTPSYMPPEQAEGATSETDARADVFSLGAIVYEALSGRMAFEAPTIPATILKVCFQEPDPLEVIAPHLPPAVVAVVMRALRKAPQERYQSVREFFDDFRAALVAAPSPAMPHAPAEMAPSAAQPSPYSATVATSPGQSSTTLSAAAAELHTPDLPTKDTGSRGRRVVVIVVAVAALVVIGLTAGFLAFRGNGGDQPSAGAATPSTDAGSPPASTDAGSTTSPMPRTPADAGSTTSPMPRTLGDAGLPAASSDAAVAPRTPPRRAAAPDPRPPPMRPMIRVPPRRRATMRRVSPPSRRRRTSKWAQ